MSVFCENKTLIFKEKGKHILYKALADAGYKFFQFFKQFVFVFRRNPVSHPIFALVVSWISFTLCGVALSCSKIILSFVLQPILVVFRFMEDLWRSLRGLVGSVLAY